MTLNLKQALSKIPNLHHLKLKKFEVFQTTHKAIGLKETVSNEDILQELQEICKTYITTPKDIQSSPTSVSSVENTQTQTTDIKKSEENFFKTNVTSLDFTDSPSFFSPQYEKQLLKKTENVKFEKLTKKAIYQLNKELQDLSKIEYEWKEYHKRTTMRKETAPQFKDEQSSFQEAFEKLQFPSQEDLSETQRAYKNYMPFKLGKFSSSLITHLHNDLGYKPLSIFLNYTPEELGTIVTNKLHHERVFNDLYRITVKKAHENLLNFESKFSEDGLSVEKSWLQDDFQKLFAIEIVFGLFDYASEKKLINPEVIEVLSRNVQRLISYKGLLYSFQVKFSSEFGDYSDIAASVLNMFIQSGFFPKTIKKHTTFKGKPRKQHLLILPAKLSVDVYKPLKFPNIVKPKKLNKDGIDTLMKPLVVGTGSVTKSDKLVRALNISRQTAYKINGLFLKLCQSFFPHKIPTHSTKLLKWFEEGNIDLGTIHYNDLRKQRDKLKQLQEVSKGSNITLRIANEVSLQLSKRYSIVVPFSKILPHCGISKTENQRYFVLKSLEDNYISEAVTYKFTQSRILLARALEFLPIYIIDTLCIRLRMYPREHWLSRTAGQLKHLTCFSKQVRLTLKGFENLLLAYYQADVDLLQKFKDFLKNNTISKKKGMQMLWEYFNENPLNFLKIEKPMYFLNLHMAILVAPKDNYYTSVNIEVDQNASALVLLSLITRSRIMAESANVIGVAEKVSPYDFIRSKSREFLDLHAERIDKELRDADPSLFPSDEFDFADNEDVRDFICNDRKLHKYAIMCYCYNQTIMGRMDDFAARWLNQFGYAPNKRQRKFLNKFASNYETFVDFVYPNTKRKLQILKSVVSLVCEESPHITMATLDGDIIYWAYYSVVTKVRRFFDPITKLTTSRNQKFLTKRETPSKDGNASDNNVMPLKDVDLKTDFVPEVKLDKQGITRRYLSYLIHSLDASILRRIINELYDIYGVRVNHLHDCVILHPNHLDAFYDVIKRIYSSPEIYEHIEKNVFDRLRENATPETRMKLDELREEFFSLTDEFVNELDKIIPHHMYSLED